MKKTLLYASILISLFTNIDAMKKFNKINKIDGTGNINDYAQDISQNYPPLLESPDEIKLHVLELSMKYIIEKNSIFEPFNNVKEAIGNISLINKEFYNLRPDLINFAKKYIQNHFAAIYANLSKEKKDIRLRNIFADIDVNSGKKLEIEAAKLIIAGANPNLLIDENKTSLLMVIAGTGKFKNLIKLLISYGIDLNMQAKDGNTALIWAIIYGHKNIVKSLIDIGANVNVQNNDGDTTLIWAVIYGYKGVLRLLIKTGASVNTQNKVDDTALIWAVIYGHKGIIKLLINAGVDIDIKGDCGNTALMVAAIRGYKNIVELLINAKADLNIQNNYGDTALSLAIEQGDMSIVELLKFPSAKERAQISLRE